MFFLISLADGPHIVCLHTKVKKLRNGICKVILNGGNSCGRILAENATRKVLDDVANNLNRHSPRVSLEAVQQKKSPNIGLSSTISCSSDSEGYAGDNSDLNSSKTEMTKNKVLRTRRRQALRKPCNENTVTVRNESSKSFRTVDNQKQEAVYSGNSIQGENRSNYQKPCSPKSTGDKNKILPILCSSSVLKQHCKTLLAEDLLPSKINEFISRSPDIERSENHIEQKSFPLIGKKHVRRKLVFESEKKEKVDLLPDPDTQFNTSNIVRGVSDGQILQKNTKVVNCHHKNENLTSNEERCQSSQKAEVVRPCNLQSQEIKDERDRSRGTNEGDAQLTTVKTTIECENVLEIEKQKPSSSTSILKETCEFLEASRTHKSQSPTKDDHIKTNSKNENLVAKNPFDTMRNECEIREQETKLLSKLLETPGLDEGQHVEAEITGLDEEKKEELSKKKESSELTSHTVNENDSIPSTHKPIEDECSEDVDSQCDNEISYASNFDVYKTASTKGEEQHLVTIPSPVVSPQSMLTNEEAKILEGPTKIQNMMYTFDSLTEDYYHLCITSLSEKKKVNVEASMDSMQGDYIPHELSTLEEHMETVEIEDFSEEMLTENLSYPDSIVSETELSNDDSMHVEKALDIPRIRVRNVETFKTPIIHFSENGNLTINMAQGSHTNSITANRDDFAENFDTLLNGSPYLDKVSSELSNSTAKCMDEMSKEFDEIRVRKSLISNIAGIETTLKRRNIVRALDYDSDVVDSEDDPEYLPSSDAPSQDEDSDLDNYLKDDNGEPDMQNEDGDDKIPNLSKDESFDISTSSNRTDGILYNLTELSVAPSRGRKGDQKHHFCPFCKTLIKDKFARHLERRHRNEEDVMMFLSMPKKSRERLKKIDSIRGKGDHMYNTNSEYNQGDLIVRRRPSEKSLNSRKSEDHIPCARCKIWYAKSTLRAHFRMCTNKKSNKRSALTMGRRLIGNIHPKACPVLKQFILPSLREGPVKDIIRFDELIIQFGNRLSKKYRSQHHHKEIRAQLRLCGRLLLTVREVNHEITDFCSLYNPKYYEDVIEAVNRLGRLDSRGTIYVAPATAAQAGTLLKKLAGLCKSNSIKLQLKEEKQCCEDFLHLLMDDFPSSVSKTVEESQTLQKRQKMMKLPSAEDIKKLWEHLEQQRKASMEKLKTKVSYTNWLALAKPTLTSVQLFNRRRAGEVERILLEDFEKCQGIQDFDKDLFMALDAKAQKIGKTYSRFVIRGKLNRIVPVLLTKTLLESMKFLTQLRTAVGIPKNNPYLFGLRHGADKDRWEWLRACELMRNFSVECNAEAPETLRGTKLRKHIATQCILLNLNSDEISDLANFMGHHEKIHREHYRQPIEARDILQVSKLLEKASQGIEANETDTDEASDADVGVNNDATPISNTNDSSCTNDDVNNDPTLISHSNYNPRKRKTVTISNETDRSFEESGISYKIQCRRPNGVLKSKSKGNYQSAGEGVKKKAQKRVFTNTSEECDDSGVKTKKRRSTSPYGCVKRRRWTPVEVKTATALYSKYFHKNHFPSLRQIAEDISKNSELQNRTPAQVKAWISNIK